MSNAGGEIILAGDVGGTKTILALFEQGTKKKPGLKQIKLTRYVNSEFKSFDDILAKFQKGAKRKAKKAAFALACPVIENRGILTNLDWIIDAKLLAKLLSIKKVALINDLAATALSIPQLDKKDIATLQQGEAKDGNIAVIAAGTGLGEAFLVRAGAKLIPVATEGGHADFAPRTSTEAQLLEYLTNIYGRVSSERVLSGKGLANIYDFLKAHRGTPESIELMKKIEAGDAPSVIANEAMNGGDKDCIDAFGIFISLYGAEAGNLALRTLATGGVYIGGGIAPKILPALNFGAFLQAFKRKGRFEGFLSNVPVHVILNENAPVIGAAALAAG